MNNILKKVFIGSAIVVLTGCQVTPINVSEPIAINTFDNSKSMAFNIANQTDLTQDYAYGGRVYQSPLRDFTSQEVLESKTKLDNAINGGTAAKIFGGLKILTGDFTGVIDVAGGLSTDLASKSNKHPATKTRWIVSVDSSKYKTELEAKQDIVNTIEQAVLSEYENYGIKINTKIKNDYFVLHTYTGSSGAVFLGAAHFSDLSHNKVTPLAIQSVDFNQEELNAYSIGLRDSYNLRPLIYPVTPSLFINKKVVGDDNYDSFMKKVTAKLPENYFYYQVSFPKFTQGDKQYIETSIVVPAIYTQGKRYDFIKPPQS